MIHRRKILIKGIVLLGLVGLLAGCGSSSSGGGGQTLTSPVTYTFTGATEDFVVPDGVTTITIEARGAGGAHNENSPGVVRNNGGLGALMSGDFDVTPGETLTIAVGGTGVIGPENGGGTGGGGGGGSGVLRGTTALVIAGGGGGAGYQTAGSDAVTTQDGTAGFGGNSGVDGGAGGTGGADGQDNVNNQSSGGGRGWNNGVPTQADPKAHAGGWGFGGGGGGADSNGHGGGGGGGYSGGGGAWDGGGGGAGSYIDGSAANVTATAGVQAGNGEVIISW